MDKQILCFYKNTTSQIQIAHIPNIVTNLRLEQVVFPGEEILFEADTDAELKIDTDTKTGVIETNKIPCFSLQVLGES
ncbi:DUF1830 domain-containing protein [Amazonocrinis nigriterrae]|uniref:DUF1830 domain-containing protein n=1 Tax=Amazonocrinis nigriterrae TaxID=2840443 RepID=UPI001CEC88E2|nr:DUF1830 domain-containing protein [Amazonocrinis nigriterrae]